MFSRFADSDIFGYIILVAFPPFCFLYHMFVLMVTLLPGLFCFEASFTFCCFNSILITQSLTKIGNIIILENS